MRPITGGDTIAVGHDRIRIAPWRGSTHTASIVPLSGKGPLGPEAIIRTIERLRGNGFTHAVTSALGPRECAPFQMMGFQVHHELHLLARDLDRYPAPPKLDRKRTRTARRGDWDRVLAIDASAFDSFWQFDGAAVRDALRATPSSRFQLSRGNPPLGYHITGRAGMYGYLQRLAVHRDAHRQGLGRVLLHDSLAWLQKRRATRVFVNTQIGNDAALGLYLAEAFELENHRLAVLQFDLAAR